MEKVLILHSGPYYFDKNSKKFELSELAKLRLRACVSLYKKKTISKIILTGGSVFGKGKLSVSALSIPFLTSRGVLKKDLVVEDKALDTTSEVELSLPKVLKSQKIAVLSDAEHLKRVRILYRNRGIKPEFLAAEDILGRSHSSSFPLKVREAILRILLMVDRKGLLVKKAVSLLRK